MCGDSWSIARAKVYVEVGSLFSGCVQAHFEFFSVFSHFEFFSVFSVLKKQPLSSRVNHSNAVASAVSFNTCIQLSKKAAFYTKHLLGLGT